MKTNNVTQEVHKFWLLIQRFCNPEFRVNDSLTQLFYLSEILRLSFPLSNHNSHNSYIFISVKIEWKIDVYIMWGNRMIRSRVNFSIANCSVTLFFTDHAAIARWIKQLARQITAFPRMDRDGASLQPIVRCQDLVFRYDLDVHHGLIARTHNNCSREVDK